MNPNEAPQKNIHGGTVQLNHGGHEVNDMHEVLDAAINVLNEYMIHYPSVKDPELKQMMDRQYRFMVDEYNMLVQCFSTGQDPAHGTKSYQMTQSNETITYGLKPSQPKKPIQSTAEVNDSHIAGHLIGLIKAATSGKTMAAFEVTNPVVRRVLQDSIPNCIEMGYELFLWQNKHGHYQVPQYTAQDTQAILQSFAPATGASLSPTGQMLQ
ncbi:spore coat protein [Thermoflavimicrobium daqui]|uniref:Spore coat protein n=2 Tax=Thermoflavimicrobium daqui TaxID=2137476 RepID=A0A364K0N4_9BACL|nr:spore coat protein [Thermoflavimicrobium daqui]RAL21067.1 spore coat protein [Thermoflavimicrobium daqui]